MRRKAQGLSVTTIVIAALAVLVLVVLAVIFTGRAGVFTRTVTVACEANGGQCALAGQCQAGTWVNPTNREGKPLKCEAGAGGQARDCCVAETIYESLGMSGGTKR
ncbi:hypothetical protein KY312_00200 [Candidatus Woesearchaeota archaeon]|nr:hypothetical protein [Candidatus Woesearchaeota archaeon]